GIAFEKPKVTDRAQIAIQPCCSPSARQSRDVLRPLSHSYIENRHARRCSLLCCCQHSPCRTARDIGTNLRPNGIDVHGGGVMESARSDVGKPQTCSGRDLLFDSEVPCLHCG